MYVKKNVGNKILRVILVKGLSCKKTFPFLFPSLDRISYLGNSLEVFHFYVARICPHIMFSVRVADVFFAGGKLF